ncbi:DUF4012 domain-containing protein [Paractinoplanes rishiriensis]|uniref:DUF4012 domain-containing protein n=1 Tax=Paractinoplanes rishiriensis TaxID=1050105 RepID=A0A919JT16_9ACTN|nr:DUF4012 domain-containing protein [Actinoplanes rishiriensis]GIE93160.1 hypothetical protein Ari01nite_06250 [Actinoplanes rishiriensis]
MHSMESTPAKAGRAPTRRRVVRVLILSVLLCGSGFAVAGWEARQAAQARGHLLHAATLFDGLQSQLAAGSFAAASTTVTAMRRETAAAKERTGDLAWRLGGHAPAVGDDVRAVRTVTSALDDLAAGVLPSLVNVAARIEALAPRGGVVDLAALSDAASELGAAEVTLRRIRDRISAISTGHLVGPLAAPIAELDGQLSRAVELIGSALRAAKLIAPMLGASGPRTYLALFQNPAEVRATGGMPGAYLVIEADRGVIRVVDDGMASGGLAISNVPVLALNPEMTALYGTAIGRYPANINQTPDFPTVARLAREMYRRHSGRTVDGVLATDPVALSYLLGATGPVVVPGGPELRADNAVHVLLSDVYAGSRSRPQQDAYFRTVAHATFAALSRRPIPARPMLAQLARAAGERRLLAWSARPDEQRLLAGTVLEGVLPQDRPQAPTVGVFLNDGGGGKMSYYLRPAARLGDTGCKLAGRSVLKLRLTLSSTAPAKGLSPYVRNSAAALDPYTIRTHVSVFSPTGGSVIEARLDGVGSPFKAGSEGRRAVGIISVDLAPGTSRRLEVTLLADSGTVEAARLWTTPTISPWRIEHPPAGRC